MSRRFKLNEEEMAKDETLKDYTDIDVLADLTARNSVLNEYEFTDALGFDQEYEGVPGYNALWGANQIKKKTYADTQEGIWMGIDKDGKAKMNIGDSVNFMTWDGNSLDITGSINATSGQIDGWTISSSAITGDGSGILQTGTTGFFLRMSGVANAYQFMSSAVILAELVSTSVPFSGSGGAAFRHGTGEVMLEVSGQGVGLGSRQVLMTEASGNNYFGLLDNDAGDYYLIGNMAYQGDWFPESDGSYDLGTTSLKWRNVYVDNSLILEETGAGSDTITIKAPSSISSSYTLTLPTTDGTSGQVLETDGSGVLSWVTPASSGANTALSNLASVAVNADLDPGTHNTRDFGSAALAWEDLFVGNIFLTNNEGQISYNSNVALDFFAKSVRLGSTYEEFAPNSSLTANLGATTRRWSTLFVDEINATGDLYPTTAAGSDLGTATLYWNVVNYKTLTDRGCLGWYDEGVETRDGRKISDVQALREIRKHPTKKTPAGAERMDYESLPKHVYVLATGKDGKPLPRDEKDRPYEEYYDEKGEKQRRYGEDGAETTALISIMIGAIKELSLKIDALEAKK